MARASEIMGRPRESSDDQILSAARRCFFERGISVSANEIAKELGVSHTTLFNRFESKEGLMIAALSPPQEVPWVAALNAGPDEREIRDQLVAHAQVMAVYFRELQHGLSLLQAAGIDLGRVHERPKSKNSPPHQAYQAFVSWLERARTQGRISSCDVETLASTILGSLQGFALTARVCEQSTCAEDYVTRLIELLWNGIS